MTRSEKAAPLTDGSTSKTYSTCGEMTALPQCNSITRPNLATSVLERITAAAEPIRCYRCFSCGRSFAAAKMSGALVICRKCLKTAREKGSVGRQNHIDRIITALIAYLRGRMEVR